MHSLETRRLLPPNLESINSLDEYKATGGLQGLEKAKTMSPEEVCEVVLASGLRGRGGAGFPTGIKWKSVRSEEGTKYVVTNSAEGEPGTFKDRYLLRLNPYKLLEGMMICSYAVDAKQAFIGIKKRFTLQVERIQNALHEFEQAGIIPPGFIEIVLGPDDYLFGEEKALLEVIDGRSAMPRNMPPYMQGARFTPTENNPTVVNNVESMSHLPSILANGPEWFKEVGSEDTPGTMIFTVSGDVQRPGVYEIPCGTTMGTLINDVCGGAKEGRQIKAIFSGVACAVMTPDVHFDVPLEFTTLRKAGGGLGSAGFIVYDDSASMVFVARMLSEFLAKSSCGQCIPCNSGTKEITDHLAKIEKGEGSRADLDHIMAMKGRITDLTRCFLPVQEQVMIPSIIQKFRQEFEDHIDNPKELREVPLPKIDDYDMTKEVFVYDPPKVYD